MGEREGEKLHKIVDVRYFWFFSLVTTQNDIRFGAIQKKYSTRNKERERAKKYKRTFME